MRLNPKSLAVIRPRSDWDVVLQIVKVLLARGSVPSISNCVGQHSLHLAAWRSSAAVVSVILEKSPTLINKRDAALRTALYMCCERDDDEALRVAAVLVEKGADLEAGDVFSVTPLLAACA